MTTPPPHQNPYAPQGGNPYGQQPGPYGQQPPAAPYGQQPPAAPYGQQPPAPPYGQQPTAPMGQPGGWGTPVPPPARPRRSPMKIIRNIVLPILGLIIAGAAWIFGQDDAETLQAGQCLENTGSSYKPNIQKRDCTASNATHKVLKKVKGTSSAYTACENVEGTTAAVTWRERSDSFVLCLASNKK
ncbi:hypothetical protein [Streptomyces sp. NPDC021096]|uniref:LppU/SCO3897 family protein n=1 Tax=Streptomyces sp. NPDC021096 TaxID=3154792 RepID=UPI003409FD33